MPEPFGPSVSGEATGDLWRRASAGPEDFPAEGMAGQVALVERGELTFSDKVANAAAAGAAAVIVYNNEEGSFRGELGEESAIPAVASPRRTASGSSTCWPRGRSQCVFL